MMNRATSFATIVSPTWPVASGPVMSSAALVMVWAVAKPTQEAFAAASSKVSQSNPRPVAPLRARQNRQRVDATAQLASCGAVVDGDGTHFPWNIETRGATVAPHVAAILSVRACVLLVIFPSGPSAARIAERSCAPELAAGPLFPASE